MNKDTLKKNVRVACTLYISREHTSQEIKRILTARKIKAVVALKGANVAEWARDLGVTRAAFYHVIDGRDRSDRIRRVIEERLEQTFWN